MSDEEESKGRDSDDAYDEWRDNCVMELDEAVRRVVRVVVEDKYNYFRCRPDRAFKAVKSFVDAEVERWEKTKPQ